MNEIGPITRNQIKYLRQLKLKKFRKLYNKSFGEGLRLFSSGIEKNIFDEIFIAENILNPAHKKFILTQARKYKIPVFLCTEKEMNMISDDQTAPGILFTISKNISRELTADSKLKDSIVYLENISDPGNLGTLLRTCAFFGFTDVILGPGSVDVLNPKCIRASAGGLFLCRIITDISVEKINEFAGETGYKVISTVVSGGIPLNDWKIFGKNIIFFGSEASGISGKVRNISVNMISIPGSGKLESLNLAASAAILMNKIATDSRLS